MAGDVLLRESMRNVQGMYNLFCETLDSLRAMRIQEKDEMPKAFLSGQIAAYEQVKKSFELN